MASISDHIDSMSVKELKNLIHSKGGSTEGFTEKSELRAMARQLTEKEAKIAMEEVDTNTLSQEENIFVILRKTPASQVGRFLSETLKQLSGGLTVDDIPTVATKVCGKVFQDGDLCYNCRDCEHDPTCVQCMECFQRSNHDGHQIYVHRAGVGGCCDCGDLEAWDEAGCCTKHGPNAEVESDPAASLPDEMRSAAEVLFGICCKFLTQVMEQEVSSFHFLNLPAPSLPENEYHLIIHNDDVHTFDEVIGVLRASRTIRVDSPREVANNIDKLGRSAVFSSAKIASCFEAANDIRNSKLLMSIAPASQLETEKTTVAMIVWIRSVCEASPGLGRVLLTQLLREDTTQARVKAKEWMTTQGFLTLRHDRLGTGSILDTIILVHCLLPKLLIRQIRELFLRMVIDDRFRAEIGCSMGNALPSLAYAHNKGLGVQEDSLLQLNVQLFTVKSLAVEYFTRFNSSLLLRVVDACADSLDAACAPETGLVLLDHSSIIYRRYRIISQNFRYVLHSKVLNQFQPEELLKVFTTLIQNVLDTASFLDVHSRRQELDHVPNERQGWAQAFNLTLDLALTIINPSTKALCEVNWSDQTLAEVVVRILKYCIAKCSVENPNINTSVALGHPISFHLPTHRFAAILFRELLKSRKPIFSLCSKEDLLPQPVLFMEKPLNTIVANAQIRAGLWRRDGLIPYHEMSYYSMEGRHSFYDFDLCSIQMGGCNTSSDAFFKLILDKFGVYSWLCSRVQDEGNGYRNDTAIFVSMTEECLRFLVSIVASIPKLVSIEIQARLAIIHMLGTAPTQGIIFDQILHQLENQRIFDDDKDSGTITTSQVEDILVECAKVSSNDERRFELKSEFWMTEYDPFFWHLTPQEQEVGNERRDKHFSSEKPNKPVPFTPKPYEVLPEFEPVKEMFSSKILIVEIIRMVLCDAAGANDNLRRNGIKTLLGSTVTWSEEDQSQFAKRTSPILLRLACHLLTLSLWEDSLDYQLLLEPSSMCPQISILECISSLKSLLNNKEAEGSGMTWILEKIEQKFRGQANVDAFFESTPVSFKEDKKESRKRRAVGAQQAMMEKMRNAQQQAVKNLFTEDEVSMEQEQDDETPVCSLCREVRTEEHLGYFAYSHRSCWDSIGKNPLMLSRRGPPMGWTRPASTTTNTNSARVTVTGQTSSTTTQNLDWGMADIAEVGITTSNMASSFHDEDDDDEDGDEDEMEEEEEEEAGQLMEEYEMVGSDDSGEMPDILASHRERELQQEGHNLTFEESRLVLNSPHGLQPSQTHIRCCPHVVHLSCLEGYHRASTGRQELQRFGEFYCSVCKSVSNTLMFVSGLENEKEMGSEGLASESWTISKIDFQLVREKSQDVKARTVEKLILSSNDRMQQVTSSIASIPFSFTVRVDSYIRNNPFCTFGDILADASKSRNQSLAIFHTMTRGALALLEQDILDKIASHWNDFLTEGRCSSFEFAPRLTHVSRNVVRPLSDLEVLLTEPNGNLVYSHLPALEMDKLDLKLFDHQLVVFSSQIPEIKIGWRVSKLNGESVEGKKIGEITSMRKASNLQFVESSSSLKVSYILDCDPFDLFCTICSLNWSNLTYLNLHNITKLAVALCITRTMMFGSRSELCDQEEEMPVLEGMMKRLSTEPSQNQPLRKSVLEKEISMLLNQIGACFSIFLGTNWVGGADLSFSCGDSTALWKLFKLPTPSPFDALFTNCEELEKISRPWIRSYGNSKPAIYRPLTRDPLSSHFVTLPFKYEDLYARIMSQKCPTKGTSPPKEPALCLLCGDLVCAGSFCCKRKDLNFQISLALANPFAFTPGVGAATLHSRAAGDSLGVFLLVQRARILLMNGGRFTFIPAPYVDSYGETDPGLKKGRPLTLSLEKYESLQKLVSEHRLASEIIRLREQERGNSIQMPGLDSF